MGGQRPIQESRLSQVVSLDLSPKDCFRRGTCVGLNKTVFDPIFALVSSKYTSLKNYQGSRFLTWELLLFGEG